ncbi:MAG: hypothetical protein GY772_29760 [bacterium]|nr:hypothetical protein [bacterium]
MAAELHSTLLSWWPSPTLLRLMPPKAAALLTPTAKSAAPRPARRLSRRLPMPAPPAAAASKAATAPAATATGAPPAAAASEAATAPVVTILFEGLVWHEPISDIAYVHELRSRLARNLLVEGTNLLIFGREGLLPPGEWLRPDSTLRVLPANQVLQRVAWFAERGGITVPTSVDIAARSATMALEAFAALCEEVRAAALCEKDVEAPAKRPRGG